MEPKLIFLKDGNQISDITNLGIVPVGVSKLESIQVRNIGDVKLDEMKVVSTHADVTIVNSPKQLIPNEEGTIVIEYTPRTQIDKGIESVIQISGSYVV